jgi:hypothetical protein
MGIYEIAKEAGFAAQQAEMRRRREMERKKAVEEAKLSIQYIRSILGIQLDDDGMCSEDEAERWGIDYLPSADPEHASPFIGFATPVGGVAVGPVTKQYAGMQLFVEQYCECSHVARHDTFSSLAQLGAIFAGEKWREAWPLCEACKTAEAEERRQEGGDAR